MTSRARRWWSLLFVGALATGGCERAQPSVLRVGDGIPRAVGEANLLDVIKPLLGPAFAARADLARWKASSPDMGVGESEQAHSFVADSSVVAVVGHAGSKGTLLTRPIYTAAGMPVVVPTATARAIGDPAAGVFTLAPPDHVIGAFLVDEAVDRLGAQRIGILHVADPYGDGVRDGIRERLRVRGDSLVGTAALSGRECSNDELSMEVIVRAFLKRSTPDAVIVVLPQKAAWCAIRRLAGEQPGMLLITSDSYGMQKELPLTREERANLHSLLFWEAGDDSLTRNFVQRTREVLGHDPDPGEALTFDAFRLIAAAIQEGHHSRDAISKWLRELGTPGHPAFPGITGPIDFTTPRKSVLRLRSLADTAAS